MRASQRSAALLSNQPEQEHQRKLNHMPTSPILKLHPITTDPSVKLILPDFSQVLGVTDDGFAIVEQTETPVHRQITVTLLVVKAETAIPAGAAPGYIGYFRKDNAVYAVFRQAV
jgi:hypothetical protein